ncbi:AsmA-like C-terminal region-containing protein [Rariglobus hedericola]|uniref:Uncharacterized protein n=1 Tax=Rariglobus hedericola TaxID=2597822 RepID=A0A556QR51_9BACT|nr:AsmA-like C-terminal region-containing protein [Rariglobus hedericola]TSJ79099.1 hypothetical protein FPL22_07350 [Rariglobus hedericola]
MRRLRQAWKVCGWCTRHGFRASLWTTWLLLLAALAGQIHLLSSRRVPVPDPLHQIALRQLAVHGVHFDYDRALMDFYGHVILENVRIGSIKTPATPLITARSVYVHIDPWLALAGRIEIEEIRVGGLDLHLPPSLSPSGIDEVPVSNIDLGIRPRGRRMELSYFTGYIGRLPVQVSGLFDIPEQQSGDTTPDPTIESITRAWVGVARHAATAQAWLAPVEAPRLHIRLDETSAAISIHADSIDVGAFPSSRFAGKLTDIEVRTTLPIASLLTSSLVLQGSIGELALDRQITAGGLIFQLNTAAGFDPRSLELQLGSLRWKNIEVGPLAITAAQPTSGFITTDTSFTLAGAAWRLQASATPANGTAQVSLNGFIGDDTLAFAGGLIDRDLSSLLDPDQPAPVYATASFGPGWKLTHASGRLHSGFVLVGGVPLDETGTEFTYDGAYVVCDNLVLRLGNSLAHGSYEMDTKTMDFRFLLTGSLRPDGISPWFHAWWTNFWRTFDFSRGLPVADVDVRGRWGDLTATQVFVQADGPDIGLKGVDFDRVRTRLFLRPHWFDIRYFEVNRAGNEASGWLSRSLDLQKDTWTYMEFDVDSGLPLETISRLFPDESAELLAPYKFSQPPSLRLSGRVDSDASPSGKQEHIDIGLTSTGAMTYHDFPLSDLEVQARLRDDRIELPALAVNFAGGHATGQARLWGEPDKRRLAFDISLAKANLGSVTQALTLLQPAPVAPVAPLTAKAAEAARIRQERLDRGSLDFNLAAEGLYSDFYTYKGGGRARITGAELAQLNLFGPLSEALHGTFFNLGSFSLNTVDAPFTLDGEQVHFDNLRVTGPSALLQAKGDYHLRDSRLAFNAKIHPFDENPSMVGTAVDFVLTPFSKVFEVKLQGTLAKPSWIFAYGPSRWINTITGGEKTAAPAPVSKGP